MTKIVPSDDFSEYMRQPFEEILKGFSTDPAARMTIDSYHSFSKEAYKEGLLAKVLEKAGDAVMSYAEVRKLLFGAIHEQMTEDLEQLKLPFSALVAAISDEALVMNIPAMGAGIGSSAFLMFAPLLAESAIATIIKVLQPAFSEEITKTHKAAETFLGALIGLKIQNSSDPEVQIFIPIPKNITTAFMIKEIQQIKEEFATLFAVADQEGIDTSSVGVFRDAPERALALLRQAGPQEQGYILPLLGVWAANRNIVQTVLFKRPYEELHIRYDSIKNALLHDLQSPVSEEIDMKLMLIYQLLTSPPLLAHYLTIKQYLTEVEESLESYTAKKFAREQLLLFRAASEIRHIACGKVTAEYSYIGVMHTQLVRLAKKIEEILPKKAEELLPEQMQKIVQDINEHLQLIKSENFRSFAIILKSHPRTLLYLLYNHSSLLEEVGIPIPPISIKEYDVCFEELIQRLVPWKSFLRYQPQVLRALLRESKKESTSELAKASLRVVYKAIIEMLASLEPEEAEPLRKLL